MRFSCSNNELEKANQQSKQPTGKRWKCGIPEQRVPSLDNANE